MTPPIKRVLPAKSTKQIAEALREVVLELEPALPAMKKYRKYLQKQNTDDDDIKLQLNCKMASAHNSVQNPWTRTVQHNHVIIQYQQPPDPAIVNHVLEILVAIARSYAQKNIVQIPYIQDYLDQIVPFLQTLYSESAQRVLQQGVPPPPSNTIYSPPACSDLQQTP